MIFGAFENVHVCSLYVLLLLLLLLFPTATEKVAYVIRTNCSDPCSVSSNPGRRNIKIEKI